MHTALYRYSRLEPSSIMAFNNFSQDTPAIPIMRIEPREQHPIQGPNGGTAMFRLERRLLQGPALQAFDAANITVPGNQMTFQRFEMVLNEMAKSYFTEDAASKQLEYLRNVKKPLSIPIKQFASRMLELNYTGLYAMPLHMPGKTNYSHQINVTCL